MDNPITVPLPQNLPTDWAYGQTVAPNGSDVGLATQYGYNYLMSQVNAAQQAAQEVGQSVPLLVATSTVGKPNGVAELDENGQVPEDQLPPMNYDPAGSAQTVQQNLNTHINNKNNPHAVTAAQAGADPAGSAQAVQGNLTSHVDNTNNPHQVTAQQVGADPAGSASAVQTNLNAHIGNTNNPHQVTAQQVGTYHSADIMASTIPALYGLGSDAVPSDVLQVLSRFHAGLGNEYLWSILGTSYEEFDGYYQNECRLCSTSNSGNSVQYADKVSSENGKISLVTPTTVSVSSLKSNPAVLKGKYFLNPNSDGEAQYGWISKNQIVKISESANVLASSSTVYVQKSDLAVQLVVLSDTGRYVNSPDPSAYPPSVSDGYTYESLGQLGNKVQIATGSYTGTGTYGASNPNSLTFDFQPKIWGIILSEYITAGDKVSKPCSLVLPFQTINTDFGFTANDSIGSGLKITVNGNTVNWYTTNSSASNQYNTTGTIYYYAIVG